MYTLNKVKNLSESNLLSSYRSNPSFFDEICLEEDKESKLINYLINESVFIDNLHISITEDESSSIIGYLSLSTCGKESFLRANTSSVEFKDLISDLIVILKLEGIERIKIFTKEGTSVQLDSEASFERTDILFALQIKSNQSYGGLKSYRFELL
jgi:hypothetical protein